MSDHVAVEAPHQAESAVCEMGNSAETGDAIPDHVAVEAPHQAESAVCEIGNSAETGDAIPDQVAVEAEQLAESAACEISNSGETGHAIPDQADTEATQQAEAPHQAEPAACELGDSAESREVLKAGVNAILLSRVRARVNAIVLAEETQPVAHARSAESTRSTGAGDCRVDDSAESHEAPATSINTEIAPSRSLLHLLLDEGDGCGQRTRTGGLSTRAADADGRAVGAHRRAAGADGRAVDADGRAVEPDASASEAGTDVVERTQAEARVDRPAEAGAAVDRCSAAGAEIERPAEAAAAVDRSGAIAAAVDRCSEAGAMIERPAVAEAAVDRRSEAEAAVDRRSEAGAAVDRRSEAGAAVDRPAAGGGVDRGAAAVASGSKPGPSGLQQRSDATKRAFSRADALVSLAQGYLRGGQPNRSPVEIMLTISDRSLRAEDADPIDVADMGEGFVSRETARRLSCDAGVIEVTEGAHGEPLSVGRKRRTITGALKRALRKRDTACTFPGCTHKMFLEGHHIQHWADGGESSVSNAALLCNHHHRYVHEYGYLIELGPDQRPRFRDPSGRLVMAVPEQAAIPDLGWRQIRAANEPLAIDAETIACEWDGTRVDYGAIVGHLVTADGLS